MSEFNVGDKVYLECEVRNKDMSDNKYTLKYKNGRGDEYISTDVKDDVLHTPDDAYNKGLNDAWELAGKILIDSDDGGYTLKELEEIFGTAFPSAVFTDLTPQKALEMVKDYEEHNKIKKGDVVRLKGCCCKGIVTKVTETNICLLYKDGSCKDSKCSSNSSIISYFEKTGEHFDSIDEFMRSEK